MANLYTNCICKVGLPGSSNKTPSGYIDLTIGVFFDGTLFDGTLNNKYNTAWTYAEEKCLKDGMTDSYQNDYTNIAKLWKYYKSDNKNIFKVYIEGPGTKSPLLLSKNELSSKEYKKRLNALDKNENEPWVSSQKGDYTQGKAFGKSETGINAKIERACWLVTRIICKACKDNKGKLRKLTLDVYGFSRGAASARSFVSGIYSLTKDRIENSEGYQVSLSPWIFMYPYTQEANITIRFLGLFDTVSSYSRKISINPNFNNDVHELTLNIPSYIKRTVQLAAADEYRKNFALTNIRSASNKGREIFLPGAHSDIGGGYPKKSYEDMYESVFLWGKEPFKGNLECRGYMTYDELVSEGWLPSGWNKPIKEYDIWGFGWYKYNKVREVRNDYARIPCYIMYKLSTPIPYKTTLVEGECRIYEKDKDLKKLEEMIISKIMGNQPLYEWITDRNGLRKFSIKGSDEKKLIKSVRYEFFHLSAYNSGFFTGYAHNAADNNIRQVINDTM